MLKKWLNGISSILLAFTFFLPLLTNTIAHAEEVATSTVQKLESGITNLVSDSEITTTVKKDTLSDSLKNFTTLSVQVFENDEPKITSDNISSFVKTGVTYNEAGIKTSLKPHDQPYDLYVLTILYSENKPLAYHLEKISINNNDDKLQLSEDEISIAPSETKEVTLTFINDKGEKVDVTKSPDLIAENVDGDLVSFKEGHITAGEDFGTAEVVFTYKNYSVTLTVNVEEKPELESIKIDPKEFKLAVGKTLQLKVYGFYSDGTKEVLKEKLTWQTSNSGVATVKDGIVTALKEGKSNVIITVSYEDFSAKTEGKIYSQESAKIKYIYADPSKLKLKQGDKKSIKIFAKYTDGTKKDVSKDVKWNIINTKVVTFSDGKIVAKSKGGTSVKASYQNFKTNITVVVEKKGKHGDDDDDDDNDRDNHHKKDHDKHGRKKDK